jgi:alkanesulfonate monooxygenase SsuD/methylene tetrahydromethanopterin reductase-like flavin-dependent oxidoreductase (luciferase family)
VRFSIFQLPLSPTTADDPRTIAESLHLAELADQLGFDGVWLAEHNFTGESAFADPIVYGTAVAMKTKNVEIGFAVLQLALHHPIRLAIQLSLLDQLSNGRLRVGIARGSAFNEWEYRGFGLTIEDGRKRFAEAADLLIKAWTVENLVFEGEYYKLETPAIRPVPVQKPHPPIYRAALTPESTAEIGRQGYPILFPRLLGETVRDRIETYTTAMREAGFPEDRIRKQAYEAGFLKSVHVAPTDEEAWADVQAPSARSLAALTHSRELYNRLETVKSKFGEGPEPLDPQVDSPAGVISATMQRGLVVGSPESVRAQLADLQTYGLNHVMAAMSWGDMPIELSERSMRLFASEVMPALRDAGVPAAV